MATYYKKLYFNNSAFEVFTDFPVLIIVDDTSGEYSGLDAYDSVSFYASDGTLLDWECAEFNDGDKSYYFVKVPSIAKSDTDYIYMYWGDDVSSVEDKTGVWDSNYKAVYHMKDETTSTILDSTSNDNDGTKKGANEPIEADGDIGKCQDFDGSDDYIEIASDGTGKFDKPSFTIEAYYNLDAVVNYGLLWSYDYTSHASPLYAQHLRISDQATYDLYFGYNMGGVKKILAGQCVTAGEWGYSTVIVEDGNQELTHNGVSQEARTYAGTPTYYAQEVWIGKSNFDITKAIEIAELRFSDTVRSQNYLKAQDKILRQQDYVTFGATVETELHKIIFKKYAGIYYTDEVNLSPPMFTSDLEVSKLVFTDDADLIGERANETTARHVRSDIVLIRGKL